MKYLAYCSYNGRAYEGFQRQVDKPTIQGTLEEKISHFCGENVQIHGVGRTDSGVHAIRYPFSFATKKDLEKPSVLRAINSLLPPDIRILSFQKVSDSFDARHSCKAKVYEYRLTYGEIDPFQIGTITQIRRDDFDVDAFKAALNVFVGEHDFSNFTTKKEDKDSFIRIIESIDVDADLEQKKAVVRFKANGFMTYQIRLMIGASIKVATKRMSLDELKGRLNEKPRHIVSFKAPPDGLYLLEAEYGDLL